MTVARSQKKNLLTIVTPVYNDWIALGQLLREIESVFPDDRYDISVVAVDDCSSSAPQPFDLAGCIASVDIAHLTINVGHQRAIAVGLVHIDQTTATPQLVAVMDSDGEDRPVELRRMVEEALTTTDTIIVAQRRKRSETIGFRLFYKAYVATFRLLTGQRIDFGNFSVTPSAHVARLVHNANIWNNFAATLLQSKLPLRRLPTERGVRYAGRSHMRLVGLVTHGLGAMSVFSEAVFVRILIASLILLGAATTGGIAVLAVRLFSTLAIPGWTTSVLGFALLLAIQAAMLPITVAFLLLNNRASFQSIPREAAGRIIERVERAYLRDDQ